MYLYNFNIELCICETHLKYFLRLWHWQRIYEVLFFATILTYVYLYVYFYVYMDVYIDVYICTFWM